MALESAVVGGALRVWSGQVPFHLAKKHAKALAMEWLYLRLYNVAVRAFATLMYADDKARANVGDPGMLMAPLLRPGRAPSANGAQHCASDHDYHAHSMVPRCPDNE